MYSPEFVLGIVKSFQGDYARACKIVQEIAKIQTEDLVMAFQFSQNTWECFKFIVKAPTWNRFCIEDLLIGQDEMIENATQLFSIWVGIRLKKLTDNDLAYLTNLFKELSLKPDVVMRFSKKM